MSVLVLETAELVAEEAARQIARAARRAVGQRGRFSLALAGGTTPRRAYELLAETPDVPWGAIDFYFGDERAVPLDDAESNYRMARLAIFDRQSIEEARIHRMRGDADDLAEAARSYESELPGAFDLVLLGMGEDGHTASLFPGSPALAERTRLVVPVTGPKPPPRRLSLTPLALERAREVLVLVTGLAKADALARALGGPLDAASLPVQVVRDRAFVVDRAAASKLPEHLAQTESDSQ